MRKLRNKKEEIEMAKEEAYILKKMAKKTIKFIRNYYKIYEKNTQETDRTTKRNQSAKDSLE